MRVFNRRMTFIYLESFVEANDVGMAERGHDARLSMQVCPHVLVLDLPSVDDLYRHLQHAPQPTRSLDQPHAFNKTKTSEHKAFCRLIRTQSAFTMSAVISSAIHLGG